MHPLLILKGCIRIQILQQRHWLRFTESMECLSSLLWGRALDRLWQVPINPILVRRVWCWKRSACVLDASVWGRARCLLLLPWTHSKHQVFISAWKEAGSQVGWENYHELYLIIYLHVSLKNIVCTWQFFMETRRAKQAYRSVFWSHYRKIPPVSSRSASKSPATQDLHTKRKGKIASRCLQ